MAVTAAFGLLWKERSVASCHLQTAGPGRGLSSLTMAPPSRVQALGARSSAVSSGTWSRTTSASRPNRRRLRRRPHHLRLLRRPSAAAPDRDCNRERRDRSAAPEGRPVPLRVRRACGPTAQLLGLSLTCPTEPGPRYWTSVACRAPAGLARRRWL